MASLFFNSGMYGVISVVFSYGVISYVGLLAAGEVEIIEFGFLYWLMVTASTVGYGDISPSSEAGKWFTSLWVIPFGLAVFSLLIGKVGLFLSEAYRKRLKGFRKVSEENHTIIIGWNDSRTMRLIQMLMHKDNNDESSIVLCVSRDMENPMPGKIGFVQVNSFTDIETMSRLNLDSASRIIIDTPEDDMTMACSLFCEKHSPQSHKTVYFQDEGLGELLNLHCPGIEVVPSVSVEMLVKSAIDPGSSLLHKELLDATNGMTQYSIPLKYKEGRDAVSFIDLFSVLKMRYDAILIAVKCPDSGEITLNPPMEFQVPDGAIIHYIADKRIKADSGGYYAW